MTHHRIGGQMTLEQSGAGAQDDSRRGWMLPAILCVLLVAMVLTSVVLWRDRAGAAPVAAPPTPADVEPDGSVWGVPDAAGPVETARLAAQAYYTFDHRHLTADAERLRALTTSGYRARYDTMFDDVRDDLVAQQVVTSAVPVTDGTATEALDSTTARVLVALDVSSAELGSPPARTPMTVRVELRRVSGSWLVSDLQAVGS